MPGWHSTGEAQFEVTGRGGGTWPEEQVVNRIIGKQLKFEKSDPSHNASGRIFLSSMVEIDILTFHSFISFWWSPVTVVWF